MSTENDSTVSIVPQSITSAVKHLNRFFTGSLRCVKCRKDVVLNSKSISSHVKTCFVKIKDIECVDGTHPERSILDKFVTFVESNEGKSEVPYLEKLFDVKTIGPKTISLQVVEMVATRTSHVTNTPRSFKCFDCDITDDIEKWTIHLTSCHDRSSKAPRVNLDSITCVCTFCQTLLFGKRENLIQHEHFKGDQHDVFFILGSYPHLRKVLQADQILPRYYNFVAKLASSTGTSTAFYCLVCDFYGLDKVQKHFQSSCHQFNVHPMFEFHYCCECSVLFYSDRELFEDHLRTPSHVHKKFVNKSKANVVSFNNGRATHEFALTKLRIFIFNAHDKQYQLMNNSQCFIYWCGLCLYRTYNIEEWNDIHLTSLSHLANVKSKECFKHICPVCKMLIYDSPECHALHYSTDGHNNIKGRVFSMYNKDRMEQNSPQQTSEKPLPKNDDINESQSIEDYSYDLENDPYSLRMENYSDCNEKIMEQFLKKVMEERGPFRRVKSFHCIFCEYYYSLEESWWMHVKTPDHSLMINEYYGKKRKNKVLCMIFCSACLYFGLGVHHIRTTHMNTKTHNNACTRAEQVKTMETNLPKSSLTSTDDNAVLTNGHVTQKIDSTNTSDDENNKADEALDEKEQLYDIIMREDSDTEKTTPSDDEAQTSSVKEDQNKEDRENEVDNPENVEYSIVISGIPAPILKNRRLMRDTFSKYVKFDRTFVKKSRPGTIYLVVLKNLESSFQKLKENLPVLKSRWGTDELSIDLNIEQYESSGIIDHLNEAAKQLFSNSQELKMSIQHLIKHYDKEANSLTIKNRIYELEMVIFNLAKYIYRNYNITIKTHVFGSRVTGLASQNSDVDIYLQIGASFRGLISQDTDVQQQLVVLFAREMERHRSDFSDVLSIPFARVPIVKFKHLRSALSCDLSFKSGLSTMNSILVKTYLHLDERIKFVACGVKLWMKLNELADRNSFTTYAQIWMVLFFLMQVDVAVAPTVIKLRHTLPEEQQALTVEGWNCAFPDIRNIVWRSSCTLTGEELLRKFFIFYSDRSLGNYVLCTLTGLKVEKKHFIKLSLPEIFEMFKIRVSEDPCLYRKVTGDLDSFCVQDPFDHCHNLTKTINPRKYVAFVELCRQTAELMGR